MSNCNAPWNKGKTGVYAEEALKKMSDAHKRKIPWNKGIPRSDETKQKISKTKRGTKVSEKTKRIMSKIHSGRKLTIEWREKMSESQRGDKNHNWKGGIFPLASQIRKFFKYRQWRDDIFTRDSFTCQKCGQIGYNLNVHHIKSFSSLLQKYEITNLEEVLSYNEFWDINNGITLCDKCHHEIHKKVMNYAP